jgi:adenosylcobinamide-GDP ribazoletransferase
VSELFAAVMFLTRLPVPAWTPYAPETLGRSTAWFPVVGLIVGGIAGGAYAAAALVFPPLLSATLAIVASVLVTGALHEDALADAADGLGGGASRERALEIMKDSRVGAYGVVALVLAIVARIAALDAIGVAGPGAVVRALVAAHVLARWSSLPLLWRLPYARPGGGTGAPFAGNVSPVRVAVGSAIAMGIGAAMLGADIAASASAAIGVTLLAGWYFHRRLGGITGDCLGAANQVVELAVYLVLAA